MSPLPQPEPKATRADLDAMEARNRLAQEDLSRRLNNALGAEARLHELDDRLKTLEVEYPQVKEKALDASRKVAGYDRQRVEDRLADQAAQARFKAWNLAVSLVSSLLALALLVKQLIT